MVTRELVRSGTTVESLVRSIADDIVSARLAPGTRLDEASLALRYAVSRTPVREALGQLSAMGLIDRRPNRGAVVAVLSDDYLHSMFEAMTELEAICARLAAQRMTATERRELETGHQAAARLVHLGAEEDYSAHNTDFHTQLYTGAHNAHIFELVVQTRSRLGPFRRAQFRLPGRLAKSWDEHDAIVTAILRGDAPGAEAAARAHVSIVSDATSEFVHGVRTAGAGNHLVAGRAIWQRLCRSDPATQSAAGGHPSTPVPAKAPKHFVYSAIPTRFQTMGVLHIDCALFEQLMCTTRMAYC